MGNHIRRYFDIFMIALYIFIGIVVVFWGDRFLSLEKYQIVLLGIIIEIYGIYRIYILTRKDESNEEENN